MLGVRENSVNMPISRFTAFYPSRPFWAGSKVNFDDQSYEGWFHDQMAEEVYNRQTDAFTIKVCRDGRIMLRIEALEHSVDGQAHAPIEDTVKKWGEYLDYLNAFYLLLDSSTIKLAKLAYFNLHEITNRDAFRVTYENGKSIGENIVIESIASVFQMGRYSSSYRTGVPIQYDPQIMMRQVISADVIAHAVESFAQVVASPGLEKPLASFAKSLSEYKVGNYETSVVLSWFITEAAISHLWKIHVDSLNRDFQDGRKRINRDRRDYLTGRDFPISLVSNLLELWDALPHPLFQDIDVVRGFRNKIVHGRDFAPGANEAQLAMKTAQEMIDRLWGLRFIPNMGYSVTGL
ncbi:MAG: hypothetical protein ABIK91_03035 [Pseudomonadota bacterium]